MHPLENLAEPINDTASGAGSGSAAHLNLGPVRKDVDIAVNATANALLTVDVSTDNSTWRQADTVTYSAASDTPSFEQYDLAYPHVRAYLNASHDLVEAASKGIDWMATMHGRRGVDRRFKRRGDETEADEMQTADVIVGDGTEDGSGDSVLNVHIGITL